MTESLGEKSPAQAPKVDQSKARKPKPESKLPPAPAPRDVYDSYQREKAFSRRRGLL